MNNSLELVLAQSEVKILLESLISKESELLNVCEISNDEDLVADTGNSLVELRLLLDPLKEKAVQHYGPNILNFSSDLLQI